MIEFMERLWWSLALAFEGRISFPPHLDLEPSQFLGEGSWLLPLECRIHSSTLFCLGDFEGTILVTQKSTDTIT